MTTLIAALFVILSTTGSSGQNVHRLCSRVDKPQCRLPLAPGPCLAYIPRYYFDAKQRVCKLFIYGGCSGNENNFASLEECLASCQDSQSICDLPKVVGPCRARIPRFFYDARTGKCERFYYGGCEGNANNFDTIQSCKQQCACEHSPPAVCSLPKEVGPCKARFVRFYYRGGRCEKFIYGGCMGNANNFKSVEECRSKCASGERKGRPKVCSLPKDTGPCRGSFRRYYFDAVKQKCDIFTYGGCRGNANNFKTKSKCQNTCKA